MKLSEKFLIKLKLGNIPQYRVAVAADVNPTTLSRIVNGAEPLKPNDPRVIRVGQVVGLEAADCFESEVAS